MTKQYDLKDIIADPKLAAKVAAGSIGPITREDCDYKGTVYFRACMTSKLLRPYDRECIAIEVPAAIADAVLQAMNDALDAYGGPEVVADMLRITGKHQEAEARHWAEQEAARRRQDGEAAFEQAGRKPVAGDVAVVNHWDYWVVLRMVDADTWESVDSHVLKSDAMADALEACSDSSHRAIEKKTGGADLRGPSVKKPTRAQLEARIAELEAKA